MGLRRPAPFALLAAFWAVPAVAADKDCQIFPPQVGAAAVYAGYSEGRMCEAGLAPLWQGVPEGAERVMRFTFSSGHSLFWRSVTITARPDGSGFMEVVGGGFQRRDVRSKWVDLRKVRRRLSAENLSRLAALAEQTGTFDHAVGTWDSSANGEGEIFLHCQLLELERADAAGYRFSSVNIGCNRPARLMPLVDEVIRLAKIDMVRRNWSAYQ
jgi:hypothetical protein